jgi:predicted SprT family Zn-dependent metalloprotease
MNTVTDSLYRLSDKAFDYFNRLLFDHKLPPIAITLQHNRPNLLGYFHRRRFKNIDGEYAHEIMLNPDTFLERRPEEILSTLVHEMAHLWQCEFGKASRSGYHNRQFADKMQTLGLVTSQTGQPGAKRTGQQMTHYIQIGGPFDVACRRFLQREKKSFAWGSPPDITRIDEATIAAQGNIAFPSQTRSKFTYHYCGQNAWAKPAAQLICGTCKTEMQLTF